LAAGSSSLTHEESAVKVTLGQFALTALEARFGIDIAAGVGAALVHYVRRLRSGRPPVLLPRFSKVAAPEQAATTVDLRVEPEVSTALAREAYRQHASVEQLITHAVFVYLADIDAAMAARNGAGARTS
jgi:hypothetical protein